MFLAKSGVQSTSFVAKRLKMERVQAYRTFKKLQEKGFIEATIERPTRFIIVPFESLLEAFINTKKSEIANLNEKKTLSLLGEPSARLNPSAQLQNSRLSQGKRRYTQKCRT